MIGDPYCSIPELRDYCQIADSIDDATLGPICAAVTNGIESYCHRQFNDAGTATARVFYPDSLYHVVVEEFSTVTGLVVKTGDTFGTTLTDYTLEPLNGIHKGRSGFPYRKIRLNASTFTTSSVRRPTVQVTARWGWAAVPSDVHLAALMQGARKFRRRYSPSGLETVGSGETAYVSRIEDPDVKELLHDFVLTSFQFC